MLTDRDPLLTTVLCPDDDLLTEQAKRPRRGSSSEERESSREQQCTLSSEAELVALDVLHHQARLVVLVDGQ